MAEPASTRSRPDVVFVAILERVVDDLNIATWQPQIEGKQD
jgi:hypothetical protein